MSLYSYTSISHIHVYFSMYLYILLRPPLPCSPTSVYKYCLYMHTYIYIRTSLHSHTSISNTHVYFSMYLYFLRQHPLSLSPTSFSRYYLNIPAFPYIHPPLYHILIHVYITYTRILFHISLYSTSTPSVVKPHQLLQVLSSYVYTCIQPLCM